MTPGSHLGSQLVSMLVLKVDSNPNDPMIPFRVAVGVHGGPKGQFQS